MKKEIRTVDEKKRIVQVTSVDERWYIRETKDKTTGLPAYEFVPSVTWICESYPKGVVFFKWLASKGWDESEALKEAAADKGNKVHQAVACLINGKTIKMDSKFPNDEGKEEELTLEEYDCIISFVDWVKEAKPKFLESEFVVWGAGYAGTVDILCEIGGKTYIVDLKTSQYIWPSHELQVSAYLHALPPERDTEESFPPHLAILQLGFRLNKKRYKFTEIDDQYDLFLAARKIWEKENKDKKPYQKDYPLEVSIE